MRQPECQFRSSFKVKGHSRLPVLLFCSMIHTKVEEPDESKGAVFGRCSEFVRMLFGRGSDFVRMLFRNSHSHLFSRSLTLSLTRAHMHTHTHTHTTHSRSFAHSLRNRLLSHPHSYTHRHYPIRSFLLSLRCWELRKRFSRT